MDTISSEKDRKDEQKGVGTAVYCKTDFVACLRNDITSDEIKTIWLEITLPNKMKMLVSSFYRPPRQVLKLRILMPN